MKLSEKRTAIDVILWNDWDPIGVNDNEEIRDEYQGYVSSILHLVTQGADKIKLSKHLYQIETVSIGVSGNMERCERVAEKIVALVK